MPPSGITYLRRDDGPTQLLAQMLRLGLDPDALPTARLLVEVLAEDARERAEDREERERLRVAAIAEARRGKRHSDATRARISAAKQGRKLSLEHRAAISAGMRRAKTRAA